MKRILLSLTVILSTGMADSVLLVKKGWQLIGSSIPIEEMSKFTQENVDQIWHFDAQSQKWLGYSPDVSTQKKIEDQNISKLTSLQNWHGFWIKSKKEWALTLDNKQMTQAPNNLDNANDIIQLRKGWNLISLPIDTVLSPTIFEGMTAWKYDSNQKWELFDEEERNFPKLSHIKNSDGIWVKAPKDTNISTMSEASKLHNFTNQEEMENRIKEMVSISQRLYCGTVPLPEVSSMRIEDAITPEPLAVPTMSSNEEGDSNTQSNGIKSASGTNLQEADVDEADILKHNGVNIFYTSSSNDEQKVINITTFEALSKGKTEAINRISLPKDQDIDSLYLINNKLVVLSRQYSRGEKPLVADNGEYIYQPGKEHILVNIFDVSNITNIKKSSNFSIDGNLKTSRVIGGKLYLISSFNPKFNIKYPKIYAPLSQTCQAYFDKRNEGEGDYPPMVEPQPMTENHVSETAPEKPQAYDPNKYAECYNIQRESSTKKYFRYDYDNPIIEVIDLLPEIEGDKLAQQALISPERLYSSAKQKQSVNITSITAIDIEQGSYLNSNSYIGNNYTQYASSKALYLVANDYPIYYDYYSYRDRSTIYKFNLNDELNYKGIGSVNGNPLNQFSLSEQNNILRIATTDGFSWSQEGTKNSIYTLKEQDGLLPIQGVLSGLGEKGERIKAVRFMGDRGYVVTFRQTDPLYTIDLSDPLAPKKVGELHVSGFSSYLHPIGENRLLGVGQDADENGQTKGLKLELFDISDFAHPTSLDSITYSQSTQSELEYNHKALAYRPSDQLLAFPYRVYGDYKTDYRQNNYLGIYQIKEDDLIAYTAMKSSDNDWGQNRGLIFDNNNTTYIAFFDGESVTTQILDKNKTED